MDVSTINPASGSASELSATIDGLQSKVESHLTELRKAYGTLDRCVPTYHEGKAEYDGRLAAAEDGVRWAEQVAGDLGLDLRREAMAIQRRLEGREGLGLTAAEWDRAATMANLANGRIANASLADAAIELRSAVTGGDKARLAAFLTAAEARLRQPAPQSTGKVSLTDKDAEQELRSLIGQARKTLRDTALDAVRAKFQKLTMARGDLSGAVSKRRAERELQRQLASGEKVAWLRRNAETHQMEWYDGKTGAWTPVSPGSR